MNEEPVLVGAVVYDPKVVVIWDIIKEFFEASGCPMDYVFFSNYELQVKALLDGTIHVAWNSPLPGWMRSGVRAARAAPLRCATPTATASRILSSGGQPGSEPHRPCGQNNRDGREGFAAGHADSARPAAAARTGTGARCAGETLRCARRQARRPYRRGEGGAACLQSGEADACAMLDLNWQLWTADGTIDPSRYRMLATTDRFDHCVFTVRGDLPEALERPWLETPYSMSYDNPAHREMMDMEGLKAWLPGRTIGFSALAEAVQRQHFFRGGRHNDNASPVSRDYGRQPAPARSRCCARCEAKRRGDLSEAEFDQFADEAVLDALRMQEDAGVDIVTDGEQRRDNFYSFVSDKLDGVRLMSLAEMLDYVEDKAGFEKLLQTLDVPAYSINNPTCVGKLARRQPLAVDEVTFPQTATRTSPSRFRFPAPTCSRARCGFPKSRARSMPTKRRWPKTWYASCGKRRSRCRRRERTSFSSMSRC